MRSAALPPRSGCLDRVGTLDRVSSPEPSRQDSGGPAFSHLGADGRAAMVDVSSKEPSKRTAQARCRISMSPQTVTAITDATVPKGDVVAVARVAGIMAAKRTAEVIPLCHPLQVTAVDIEFEFGTDWLEIRSEVDVVDRTGVEMEALHACAVAALTVYDMCKSADRSMVIGELALWEKTGGRSGTYRRSGV